jgi:predicted HTH domain antitoxin
MDTLTVEDLKLTPSHLFDDIERGEPALVMRGDEPLFMAVPLGKGLSATEVRLELAINLFDQEQISMGIAARIAGLSISEMIDELGKRKIPVARYGPGELEQELEYVSTLVDRG